MDSITRISGKSNGVCDAPSRRGTKQKLTVKEHAILLGLGEVKVIDVHDVHGDEDVMALLELCRPGSSSQTDEEFAAFWKRARPAVESFVARFPIPNLELPHT